MEKRELKRRYFVFVLSLFFSGLGVSFVRHGGVGVPPISCVPNIISLKYDFLSFGMWLFLWNVVLLLLQIIILRKDFNKIQLLQIPLSLLFGIFTDAGALIANRFPVDKYHFQLMSVFIGVGILAFGIALSVVANVLLNSGEGAVKAISDKTGFQFGNVKIVFDITNVVLACIVSYLLFDGKIIGVREGTLIPAVFTGIFVKSLIPTIRNDVEKWVKL